jgi:hypothetical protein
MRPKKRRKCRLAKITMQKRSEKEKFAKAIIRIQGRKNQITNTISKRNESDRL